MCITWISPAYTYVESVTTGHAIFHCSNVVNSFFDDARVFNFLLICAFRFYTSSCKTRILKVRTTMSRLIRKSYAIILCSNLPTHDPDLTSDTFVIPCYWRKNKTHACWRFVWPSHTFLIYRTIIQAALNWIDPWYGRYFNSFPLITF